jgi:mRNA interferase MazF
MPSTMTYRAGEVVLVSFPFTVGQRAKKRPGLVVLDSGDADVLIARITTQIYASQWDVLLTHWQSANLLQQSVVRLHKMATLEKSSIIARLGSLDPQDHKQ